MAQSFGFSGSSSGSSSSTPTHHGLLGAIVHGAVKFAGNMAGDVKDSVVGLPTGLVQTVEHPIATAKTVAGSEWQTWSPLFAGHPGAFIKQAYDHPLAPLLDVMTVFTLGAGAAARGAEILDAAGAEGRTVKALSGLRKAKTVTLHDPTVEEGQLGRHPVEKPLSTAPGKRAVQELNLRVLQPHLPKWWNGMTASRQYETQFSKDIAHRVAATNQIRADSLEYLATLKAGGVLSDPAKWGQARQAVSQTIYQGLLRHAPMSVRKGEEIAVQHPDGLAFSTGHSYVQPLKEPVKATNPLAPPKLPPHYRFLLDPEKLKQHVASLQTPEDFETFLKDYGDRALTKDHKAALRMPDGTYPVVPRHDATLLGREAASSSKMVRWLWERPSRAWKIAMVGWTPRTVVNNGVGNWFLYSVRQGGQHSLMGLYDAIRLTHGERYAKKLAAPGLYGARNQSWAYKWHLDELGNTFAHAEGFDQSAKVAMGKRLVTQGFYPIVHKFADKPVRLAALSSFYRGAPEVKALMKQGYKFDDAVDAAVANNPALRRTATERVRSVAGDYVAMKPWEQRVRQVVPFYLWDRHILKTAGATVGETPGRVALLQKVSNMGEQKTQQILGNVPEFLKGALPLQLLGLSPGAAGRKNVLLTTGINPAETLAELASTAEALTTGTGQTEGNLGAATFGINPLLTGAIEATTGRSLLTGAPVANHGGVIPSTLVKVGEDLPIPKLIQALVTKQTSTSPKGTQYLYRHDAVNPASSLLGVPIRSVGQSAAANLANAEKTNQPRF